MAKVIGFQVKIEGTDSQIKALGELRDSTIRLSDARSKLEKTAKTTQGLTAAQTKELGRLTAAQKATAVTTAELNKEIARSAKAADTAAGSYDAMTQENAQLTAQIRKLGDPLGKNVKQFERLSKRVKDNTTTLSTLDKQMGRNFRNVGNYTDSIKESAVASGLFSRELSVISRISSTLAPALKSTSGAVGGLSKAFKFLRIAIISTGIGALVLALIAVVSFFTKTQRGADLLSKAMAGIGAVIDVVVDGFSAFGEAVVNAIRSPREAFDSFMDALDRGFTFINKAVIAPFVAFWRISVLQIQKGFKTALAASKEFFGADATELREEIASIEGELEKQKKIIIDGAVLIVEAFVDIKDSITGVIDEMNREAKAAIALEGRLQRLRDLQTAFIVTESELRKEREKARLQAEDTTKTFGERAKALDRALALENKALNQELAFARERAAILAEQERLNESFTEEQIKARNEAIAKVNNLEQRSLRFQREIVLKRNAFIEKEEKRLNDILVANTKRRIELTISLEDQAFKKEELRFSQELIQATKNGEDLALLERVHQQNIIEIQIEFSKKRSDLRKREFKVIKENEQTRIDREQAQADKDFNDEFERRKANVQAVKDFALDTAQNLSDALFDQRSEQIDREKERELEEAEIKKNLELSAIKDGADAENEILKSKLQKGLITEKQFEDQKAIADANRRKQEEIAQRKALVVSRAIEKDAFEKKKVLDIKQAIINGALAITQILAQTGILAPIPTAIAVAATAFNVATIASQKFAKGGIVEGASHAQGGVKFAVGGRVNELEGGEAVINKKSTSMFGGLLSQINQIGGGKKFQDGGVVPSASIPATLNISNIAEEVIGAIKVQNVATETASVNGEVVNVENIASA